MRQLELVGPYVMMGVHWQEVQTPLIALAQSPNHRTTVTVHPDHHLQNHPNIHLWVS